MVNGASGPRQFGPSSIGVFKRSAAIVGFEPEVHYEYLGSHFRGCLILAVVSILMLLSALIALTSTP
jgi:hypothetical protein